MEKEFRVNSLYERDERGDLDKGFVKVRLKSTLYAIPISEMRQLKIETSGMNFFEDCGAIKNVYRVISLEEDGSAVLRPVRLGKTEIIPMCEDFLGQK